MIRLQEWIHKFEVGEGTRVIKLFAAVLALLALATVYDVREYKNFSTAEAMDAAQLARNIAIGKGYTTDFVRPLSLHLVEKRQTELKHRASDLAMLKPGHPDLANPPVYPLILAGLTKVLPFDYKIPVQEITKGNPEFRYQPELLIALLNQLLFFVAIGLVVLLARRLFDAPVAWLSAMVLAGSDLFWRFSVSGLSTILLVVLFLALVWCLVFMEQAARENRHGAAWFVSMSVLAGIVVGLGALTRYSFGWLVLPVLVFLAFSLGNRRVVACSVTFLVFAAVLSPWLLRNYNLSGTPFGTAGYAIFQDTAQYPAQRLERSLKPDLGDFDMNTFFRKLVVNFAEIFQNDLPRFGGSWITAFFLVGLLVPFVSPTLSRLRIFLLLSLLVLAMVQAVGRTHLSADSPGVNSENLLVLVAPLVFAYGAGMYFLLLDNLNLTFPPARYFVTAAFVVIANGSLIFTLLPPRTSPLAYPPYYPPLVQQLAGWMRDGEMMMSDVPWAVAWYGQRQSVWTTLNVQDKRRRDDFYAINDFQKPVHGLYLTQLSTDGRFYSDMMQGQDWVWGRFAMDGLLRTNVPPDFPLQYAHRAYGHLFLTDGPRWQGRSE
jgi:hypothetical protein